MVIWSKKTETYVRERERDSYECREKEIMSSGGVKWPKSRISVERRERERFIQERLLH